jgi:ubiquinone/menaquinone biosynthesis C-methylase UbiE
MLPQRERVAKANPTLAYFLNLRLCLLKMRRVLKPGGKVALVVSKEHTFWALTSREILRKRGDKLVQRFFSAALAVARSCFASA